MNKHKIAYELEQKLDHERAAFIAWCTRRAVDLILLASVAALVAGAVFDVRVGNF